MATKAALTPRKEPRQQRSRETRERILEAAARVFARHGYSAGTTNRIAEAANLSIGSLYQYFPNKDSILVELTNRHIADGTARVHQLLAAGLPDGIEALVRLAVDEMIELHRHQHDLHRVLFEEAPRPPSVVAELHAAEDRLVALLTEVLRDDPSVTVDDPELAARVVVVTIESLVHRLIAGARPVDPEPLATELVRLVVAYLVPDRPGGSRKGPGPVVPGGGHDGETVDGRIADVLARRASGPEAPHAT